MMDVAILLSRNTTEVGWNEGPDKRHREMAQKHNRTSGRATLFLRSHSNKVRELICDIRFADFTGNFQLIPVNHGTNLPRIK